MNRSHLFRHIIAGVLIAAVSFGWCVWTEGNVHKVKKYTGRGESLQERWKWALDEGMAARYDDRFWIGYSITKWMSENEYYGDDCIYHNVRGQTLEQLIDGEVMVSSDEEDEEEGLRKATLWALKNLGDEEAAEEIQDEINGEEGYAERELAILSLYRNQRDGSRLEDIKVRRMDQRFEPEGDALYWLGRVENRESVRLLWDELNEAGSTRLQERIVMAMGVHDAPNEVVPVLEKIACSDFRQKVRENAIFWLGQQKGGESLTVLKRLLRNEKEIELREKVIFALYCHEGDEAIAVLADAAKGDRSTKVRKEAIFWLGQMAAAKTLDVLSDIVVDSEETEIQEHAVFAISQHSDDEAVPTLIQIAKTHRNPEVRKKAIFWLGQTEDERALDFFVELLKGD